MVSRGDALLGHMWPLGAAGEQRWLSVGFFALPPFPPPAVDAEGTLDIILQLGSCTAAPSLYSSP